MLILLRSVRGILRIGTRPTDTRDERLRKAALVLTAATITVLASISVGTYLLLDRPLPQAGSAAMRRSQLARRRSAMLAS